jgi:hypothetical protein
MRNQNKKTIMNLLIIISLISSCLGVLNFVNAVSTETTGLTLSMSYGSNLNKYLHVGTFDIFVTDKKLIFYLDDGTLAKTSDISFGHTPNSVVSTTIDYWNNTHVIVNCWYSWTGSGNRIGRETFFLNVDTLAYTDFCTDMTDVSADGVKYGTIINANSGIYAIETLLYSGSSYRTYTERLYPTYSLIGYSTYNILNDTTAFIIPSSTESNIIYCVGHGATGTNRYSAYKLNLNDNTTSLIGTSATDGTWSTNSVYNFGYSYDTDGSSNWYDIGIVYDDPTTVKSINVGLIRFNDTFVDINHRVTGSVSSAVNLIRCMSVPYSGIRSNTSLLLSGDFRFAYVGTSYEMMQVAFSVIGLNTNYPNVTMPFPTAYTYFGKTHYYTSSNAVGGLQPETSNNALLIDFQNNKCVVDSWTATNPAFSFIFTLSPSPIQLINSVAPYRAVCYQGTNYNLTGEIFVSQTRTGNGTYTVQTTGLSLDYYIDTNGTYGDTAITGTVINGYFSCIISQRVSSYTSIYEGIKFNINISTGTTFETIKFVWTTSGLEDGLPHTTPIPSPTIDTGNTGIGFSNGNALISAFGGIILVIVFALLFGAFAGKDGLLAGLVVSIFIASVTGLFPIYCVIVSIIIGALMVFSSVHNSGGA